MSENTTPDPTSTAQAPADPAGIGRRNLHEWADHHERWRADLATAHPTIRDSYARTDHEVTEHLDTAGEGQRFTAGLHGLAQTTGGDGDGSRFVTGDGFYTAEQAASILGRLPFPTADVVAAIEPRLDENGLLHTEDFAGALGDLVGEPDAAAPYQAAAAASRLASENDPRGYARDSGTYHPSVNLADYFPTTSETATSTDEDTSSAGAGWLHDDVDDL